jgi:hypothetical protein
MIPWMDSVLVRGDVVDYSPSTGRAMRYLANSI